MRSSGVSEDFHPGDLSYTQEIRHRHAPRHMKFHTPTRGVDPRFTKLAIAGSVFILAALFACLAMWLASLGAFVGGPMIIPGILFTLGA